MMIYADDDDGDGDDDDDDDDDDDEYNQGERGLADKVGHMTESSSTLRRSNCWHNIYYCPTRQRLLAYILEYYTLYANTMRQATF